MRTITVLTNHPEQRAFEVIVANGALVQMLDVLEHSVAVVSFKVDGGATQQALGLGGYSKWVTTLLETGSAGRVFHE